MKKKVLVLKKWIRYSILSILFLLLLLSSYLIISGMFPKKDNKPYYNYKINRNIDYKVYLKPNDFYEEKFLPKNKQYTSELIDYIDIDLSYLFNGSKITNMNYDYDVSATIVGEYENTSSGKSEIWTKKYVILEKQTKQIFDTTSFDINQNLKINYNQYNKIVNDYKSKFRLSIDAYLKIKLNIKYKGTIQSTKDVISDTDNVELDIPLAKNAIKIDTKYDKETEKNLIHNIEELRNEKQAIIGVIILIFDIFVFISMFNKLFINRKNYYEKILNKILKDYAEIIVEVSNPINLNGLEVFDIKNFDDMIDLEEELKSPILLYETIKGKESVFIVVNDNYAYVYTLNNNSYYR